jgi:hypothetical protein
MERSSPPISCAATVHPVLAAVLPSPWAPPGDLAREIEGAIYSLSSYRFGTRTLGERFHGVELVFSILAFWTGLRRGWTGVGSRSGLNEHVF